MRIAIDAMGGDNAPNEIVAGALEAARRWQIPITLIGRREVIEPIVERSGTVADVRVVDAREVIEADDKPVQAVKKKRDSSIVRAIDMVRCGEADGLVTAGNTGAVMTAAMLGLGKIMRRPAIGALMPTFAGHPTLLLDAGASVDARPEDLAEFAVVGSLYVENVLGVPNPKIGLVNIGTEAEKGNEQVRAAYALLSELGLNFVGNVEGRDVTAGNVDVLVCDGFVGNVVLKVVEGLGLGIFSMIREEMGQTFQSRLGGLLVRDRLRAMGKRLDYFTYGGAPMLGLKGPLIKCHGSSGARALANAVRVARDYVLTDAVGKMQVALGKEID